MNRNLLRLELGLGFRVRNRVVVARIWGGVRATVMVKVWG